MRVIGYCRVSTDHQAVEGVSLGAQKERIAGWAGSTGMAFDPADVFVDAGISGKRADNRPALREALDAACSGNCVLAVYSLSRLARSVRDTLAIAVAATDEEVDMSLVGRPDTPFPTASVDLRGLGLVLVRPDPGCEGLSHPEIIYSGIPAIGDQICP